MRLFSSKREIVPSVVGRVALRGRNRCVRKRREMILMTHRDAPSKNTRTIMSRSDESPTDDNARALARVHILTQFCFKPPSLLRHAGASRAVRELHWQTRAESARRRPGSQPQERAAPSQRLRTHTHTHTHKRSITRLGRAVGSAKPQTRPLLATRNQKSPTRFESRAARVSASERNRSETLPRAKCALTTRFAAGVIFASAQSGTKCSSPTTPSFSS